MPSIEANTPSNALDRLARALRHLHKALLDVEAEAFGGSPGSFQLLSLAANHEQFAWLRKLSALMAEIDEYRDQPEAVTTDNVAAIKEMLTKLIGPGDPISVEFRERYAAALQQSPTVSMAQAEVRWALEKL